MISNIFLLVYYIVLFYLVAPRVLHFTSEYLPWIMVSSRICSNCFKAYVGGQVFWLLILLATIICLLKTAIFVSTHSIPISLILGYILNYNAAYLQKQYVALKEGKVLYNITYFACNLKYMCFLEDMSNETGHLYAIKRKSR